MIHTAGEPSPARGYCPVCQAEHYLEAHAAFPYAAALMQRMEETRSLLQPGTDKGNQSLYTTDWLFGKARGKMFGVLVGRDVQGERQVLRAFSGQYQGQWQVPGWVDPVCDPALFDRVTTDREQAIKTLTRTISQVDKDDPYCQGLKRQRRQLSRSLMRDIHDLYTLTNFKGEQGTLREIFQQGKGGEPPTGTGDCCAPKLLHHAVLNGIQPEGLVEFYWGRENASRTRQHGHFYPPCGKKCVPILGFMLCGLLGEDYP